VREASRPLFWFSQLSPHTGRDKYQREIERYVKDLKFIAVKLHTIGYGVNPLTEDGDMVFATAFELGIPAMVHTGAGIPSRYRRFAFPQPISIRISRLFWHTLAAESCPRKLK
jgi:predicted TIM-barrel fold metal-dependent hydrolase